MATPNFTDEQTFDFKPYNRQEFSKIQPSLPSFHFEQLAKMTLDIAGGLKVILEMLEQNNIDKDFDGSHYLTPNAEGNLFRLAVRTSEMLQEAACGAISFVERNHSIDKQ